jgi:photosystem II biogenesis protein Psp29
VQSYLLSFLTTEQTSQRIPPRAVVSLRSLWFGRMNRVSPLLTVADSKRAFHASFPHVISPLYRRLVDELLVELHLLSHQRGFQADPLFAVGLVQVFDTGTRGYRPEDQREPLFQSLCSACGLEASTLRHQREQALASVGQHSVEEVRQWMDQQGEGAPELLKQALANVRRSDFHYSRLMAVGLLTLLEEARGADSMDPKALRQFAHDTAESMGLLRDRVDKDLGLYANNLEKLAQAVELMEETVAAERRRNERRAATGATPTPPEAG